QPSGEILQDHSERPRISPAGNAQLGAVRQHRDDHSHGEPRRSRITGAMIRRGIRRAFDLALRRRDRWERDVEDEIKLHLLLRADQLMRVGASPDEAYDEAVRRFGPLTTSMARLLEAARSRERRMQRTEFFADFRQDMS